MLSEATKIVHDRADTIQSFLFQTQMPFQQMFIKAQEM